LQSPTEAPWNAGAVHRGSSGSIMVSTISSTRVSGSFGFTRVQQAPLPLRARVFAAEMGAVLLSDRDYRNR